LLTQSAAQKLDQVAIAFGGGMGKDIQIGAGESLRWDSRDVKGSLEAVRAYVEAEATKASDWYFQRKRSKALISRGLRLTAVAFASWAGLLPIAADVLGFRSWPGIAMTSSLLVGMTAGTVGLDKMFGFSSGWIRYITAASMIRRALEEFRMQWMVEIARSGHTLSHADVTTLLQLAMRFRLTVERYVFEETTAWSVEFRNNLAQLEREAQPQVDARRTATREAATVAIADNTTGSLSISSGELQELDPPALAALPAQPKLPESKRTTV
jgi:hypothetical protein